MVRVSHEIKMSPKNSINVIIFVSSSMVSVTLKMQTLSTFVEMLLKLAVRLLRDFPLHQIFSRNLQRN